MNYNEVSEFTDKYQPKRFNSVMLASSFQRLGLINRASRTLDCGSYLVFRHGIDDSGEISLDGQLHKANFCRDRLCPMCNWRRSLKIFGQLSSCLDKVDWNNYKAVFVTLTVKNCETWELGEYVDRLYKAFGRLIRRKKFKEAFPGGYFRCLEVTYNERDNTYHPHLHIMFLAYKYYGPRSSLYISQKELSELWDYYMSTFPVKAVIPKHSRCCSTCCRRDCCKFDNPLYINGRYMAPIMDFNKGTWSEELHICPHWKAISRLDPLEKGSATIVHIELVKPKDNNPDSEATKKFSSAVSEVSKYVCKDDSYISFLDEDKTDRLVQSLNIGISGRRLIQYGGMLAVIHKELFGDEDIESDSADLTDSMEVDGFVASLLVTYNWRMGVYYHSKSEVITNEELDSKQADGMSGKDKRLLVLARRLYD